MGILLEFSVIVLISRIFTAKILLFCCWIMETSPSTVGSLLVYAITDRLYSPGRIHVEDTGFIEVIQRSVVGNDFRALEILKFVLEQSGLLIITDLSNLI